MSGPPCEYKDFQLPLGTGAFIGGGAFILKGGHCAGQTAAVTTKFQIMDGNASTAPIAFETILTAQIGVPILLPDCGVLLQSGIFVFAATQAVNGVVYYIPVTRHADGWIDKYANRYDVYPSP